MRVRLLPVVPLIVALLGACTGQVSGPGGTPADATFPDGTTLPDGSTLPDGTTTGDSSTPPPDGAPLDTSMPPVDAGGCSATTLADALSVVTIGGTASAGRVFGAPTATGAVAAWNGGDGVHLVTLDSAGTPSGEVTISGDRPYGLAVANDGTRGLLVNRGADALYLVGVSASGSTTFESLLIGEVDHGVTNNEWFGTGIRDGRLAWTGDRWAAYFTLQRLWDDGVAHYGDQLRLLNLDGSPDRTVWGWGCSHSMEVRISHDGTTLGPLCASDCFPDKGVFFNHRTMLYTDSRANCSGGYTAHLGGIAPMASGFVAAFTAGDGRSSEDVATVRIDGSGAPGEATFLTDTPADEGAPNIAPFDGGVIVGWVAAGTSYLQQVSADGTPMGTPEPVGAAALGDAGDFFPYPNGDVGWIIGSGGGLSVARLRDCD
jgi:hypothetical protein